MKTAVDYLFERLSTLYLFKDALLAQRALQEAKEIEKQQILDAAWRFSDPRCDKSDFEDYYNETYKKHD